MSDKRSYQSGAAKRQKDKRRKLEVAARDPKQGKLVFGGAKAKDARTAALFNTPAPGPGTERAHQDAAGSEEGTGFEDPHLEGETGPSTPTHPSERRPTSAAETPQRDVDNQRSGPTTETESDEMHPSPSASPCLTSPSMEEEEVENGSDAEPEVGSGFQRDPELVFFVSPRQDASLRAKKSFLACHPVQPVPSANEKFLFDPNKAYYKTVGKEFVQRQWLSFCKSNSSLYCAPCMTFATNSQSSFVTGHNIKGKKDIYKDISRHEGSKAHTTACEAYVAALMDKDISSLIDTEQTKAKLTQKDFKRAVVQRLIDITIFVGRQSLAYRGKAQTEAACTLEDRKANHGNFLELVLMLADYDPILKEHVRVSIEHSKNRRKTAKGSKGRGALLTFLSKTSINKLIKIIGSQIQKTILLEVKNAKIFSLQIDSTQDEGVLDQLAIVVRYVSASTGVKERLIRLVISHDNTGEGLFNLLKKELENLELDLKNIVACSFDGASNMSGCYKGLQARLKEINPDLVFTHCTAHCLNLVICDCCKNCNDVKKLFGLVETGAVFISESYKRMEVWSNIVRRSNKTHDKLRRLQKIGATRWWSKDKALRSVLDEEINETAAPSRFVDFLACMNEIRESEKFDDKATFNADCIVTSWSRFETLLTALLMQDIFKEATPVSEALQSVEIDYLATFKMVESLMKTMQEKRKDYYFDSLVEKAKNYAVAVNNKLEEEGIDIKISTDFKPVRSKDAKCLYRSSTYYKVLDYMINGLDARFTPNKGLLRDCATLDPKRFSELKSGSSPTLNTVAKVAKLDVAALQSELLSFANCYPNLVNSEEGLQDLESEYVDVEINAEIDSDSDEINDDRQREFVKCKACKKCLKCAFQMFVKFPFLKDAYSSLYSAYKYVLSIPTTQVSCERVFSKVKIIKTRLRSSLTQELFEPLIFMSVERYIALTLDKNKILDAFAQSSEELKRHLT